MRPHLVRPLLVTAAAVGKHSRSVPVGFDWQQNERKTRRERVQQGRFRLAVGHVPAHNSSPRPIASSLHVLFLDDFFFATLHRVADKIMVNLSCSIFNRVPQGLDPGTAWFLYILHAEIVTLNYHGCAQVFRDKFSLTQSMWVSFCNRFHIPE